MSSDVTPLGRELAEATLAVIKQQYRVYIEPFECEDGTVYAGGEPPVLVENWQDTGHWAIAWESGPDDWAHRAFSGGFSEELYHEGYPDALAVAHNVKGLVGQDAEEWAAERARAVATEEGVTCPKGVHAEPYYSFVLMLYPAD